MKTLKPGDRVETIQDFGGVHHGKILQADSSEENIKRWIVEWDDEHHPTSVREHFLRHELNRDYVPN